MKFDPVNLTEELQHTFLGAGSQAIPVNLHRLRHAQIIWINPRIRSLLGAMSSQFENAHALSEYLLEACAYVTPESVASDNKNLLDEDREAVGWADRYGGDGLHTNGGSGRGVHLNGFFVKGVGRTPLIGRNGYRMHSSGIGDIAEFLREVVYSEVMNAEFPYGAAPVLVVIDTGITHTFQWESGTLSQRRALIVRPSVLRPAHFERAWGHLNLIETDGALDSLRVRNIFAQYQAKTNDGFLNDLTSFASKWAVQLAYSFVHRLSHCANTTSNIAWDGALLDFGATSALPNWGQLLAVTGFPRFGNELFSLNRSIDSLAYYYFRHSLDRKIDQDAVDRIKRTAALVYKKIEMIEVLRLCGLERQHATALASGEHFDSLYQAFLEVKKYFAKDFHCIFDENGKKPFGWDFMAIVSDNPPSHLVPLQRQLKQIIGDDWTKNAVSRCQFISRERHGLHINRLKKELEVMVAEMGSDNDSGKRISSSIQSIIARCRNDTRFDLGENVPIGFAMSDEFSAVISIEALSKSTLATFEWISLRLQRELKAGAGFSIKIVRAMQDGLYFESMQTKKIPCSVSVRNHT